MFYEFQRGVIIGITTKNIQDVFQKYAPVIWTIKKLFEKFRRGDFNLSDEPGQ